MKTTLTIDVDAVIEDYQKFCDLHVQCEQALHKVYCFLFDHIDHFCKDKDARWTTDKISSWKNNSRAGWQYMHIEELFNKAKEIENPVFRIHSLLKIAKLSKQKHIDVELSTEDMIQARLDYSIEAMQRVKKWAEDLYTEVYQIVYPPITNVVVQGFSGANAEFLEEPSETVVVDTEPENSKGNFFSKIFERK